MHSLATAQDWISEGAIDSAEIQSRSPYELPNLPLRGTKFTHRRGFSTMTPFPHELHNGRFT
jgi:hypothetical protein